MSALHRVRLPRGAEPMVDVGSRVTPDEVLATHRPPGAPMRVPVAAALRRPPRDARDALLATPGAPVSAGQPLARHGRHEVRAPASGILLAYDEADGSAIVAPLGAPEPLVGHVAGEVERVDEGAIEIRLQAAVLDGVGGFGDAVHGRLHLAVRDPADELRASAIDVGGTGHIVVGGSRASAETLTRARAMGIAGIVLGGVLDKELRDFEATQQRRREIGGVRGDFAVLLVEGYGKVGFDPGLFAWFQAHDGHLASLFGDEAHLYVYDAVPPPARRTLPRPGDRVIAHRRPHAGLGGTLLRVLERLHASESGVVARAGLVRFEDGRTAIVPIANLEATERLGD